MQSLLLLSSDGRRRYAEDIQTVLAAPKGAVIRFRYPQRYVAPPLKRAVLTRQTDAAPAVLGFHSTVPSGDPFILPIRHAAVAKAERIADTFVFKLCVGGYVDLRKYERTLADIVTRSRSLISALPRSAEGPYYPATSDATHLSAEIGDDSPELWFRAARLLAIHPTFQKSYFLRVAPIETHKGKALRFDEGGRLQTVDGTSLRILTNLYGREYAPDAEFKLTCQPDGTTVRVASADVYHVNLKHDSVEFWLHSTAASYDTLSEVMIRLASDQAGTATVPAHVPLPLVVRRPRSRVIRRWAAASTGAVLVALPSILGPESPLQVRVAAALMGAGLLALSGAGLNSPK